MIACVLGSALVAGCNPDIRVRQMNYEGWQAVELDNGLLRAVMVPDIARVMSLQRTDGPDLFWQDASLFGKTANMSADQFQNFGGSKLWVAPQTGWGRDWPPVHAALDRGALETTIATDGALQLRGMACPVAGVRLDRQLALDSGTATLNLEYNMQNTTTSNVAWGIWQVIQVKPGGRVLIPAPEGFRVWDKAGCDYLRHWTREKDLLVLHHSDQNGKISAISSEGWIAYEKGGEVLILEFPADTTALYPDQQGSHEVYSNAGYIELEHVTPLANLAPRETVSTTERWHLLSLNGAQLTDRELASRIRDHLAE